MSPDASIAFACAGLSLAFLSVRLHFEETSRGLALACGPLAFLFACVTIFTAVHRFVELAGIGMTADPFSGWASPSAPRMSAAAAANFLLLGTALACVALRRSIALAQGIAIASTFLTWFGLSRYLHGVEATAALTSMAIHTAVLFFLLSLAILCAAPRASLVKHLTRDTPGGALARYLLPAAVLIPPAIGWFTSYVQRTGALSTYAAFSLFALLGVVLLASLVWATAARVDRLHEARSRAERAVLANRERTRRILQSSLDAVISIDAHGRITGGNPRAHVLFGWSEEELVGQVLANTIVPERYREAHRAGLARYVETGVAHILSERVELSALHRSGREFPVEIAITRIESEEGLEFSAFIRDITERKAAEAERRAVEVRLRAQLERLTLLDRITRAVSEQEHLANIYQAVLHSLEEHLALDFAAIALFEPSAPAFVVGHLGARSERCAMEWGFGAGTQIPAHDGFERCLRGELAHERNLAESRVDFARKLARAGLTSLVIVPLHWEKVLAGALIVALAKDKEFSSTDCEFLRQLAENVALAARQAQLHAQLKGAYEDLRQTQKTLLQQERLRAYGEMASGVAHDINNALSPASLAVGLLLEQESALSEEGRRSLELTAQSIDNAAQTIARMREFYRRSGEGEVARAPLELNRLIEAVLALTRARCRDIPQQRGIVITLQKELATSLPMIEGVESEVRDALTNLVLNAADAMPEGGTLTVRSSTRADRVIIEVIDSGTGMDELTRRRCIEPFFTTKGERGTGLGLAMVYGMAERHRAALEIESSPGCGTLVRLVFAISHAPRAAVAEPIPSVCAARALRVLLIDDDPQVLRTLERILQQDGHEITAQARPQEAVDLFRAQAASGPAFDIVVTDLGMPHLDGQKVAAAVKAASPTTPVILLTGWGHALDLNAALPAHVDRVLSKPPKLADLRRAILDLGHS
jgi:PAS domain S-box-containing protein